MKKILSILVLLYIGIISNTIILHCKNPNSVQLSDYNLTDIISDPSGDLYLATEYGGLFRSTDGGDYWFLTNTITTKYKITTILYDDFEGLFLSTMDGAFLQSTDKGLSWRIRRGDEYYNGFEPVNCIIKTNHKYKIYGTDYDYEITLDNHNFAASQGPAIIKLIFTKDDIIYGCGEGLIRNDDVDSIYSPWIDIRNGLYLYSYYLAEDENNRIYVGTDKGIYFTDNKGDLWNLLSEDLKNYRITMIYIGKDWRMLINIDSVGIYESLDSGKSWKQKNQPLINIKINKIYEYNHNVLFAITKNDGLFKSLDNGLNWQLLNSVINNKADSTLSDGWMPSINFYDLIPNLGQMQYMQFFNKDSMIAVKGTYYKISLYNIISGKLIKEFNFQFNSDYLNITGDSLIVSYRRNDSIIIQIYDINNDELINSFYYTRDYVKKRVNYYYLKDAYIVFSYFDNKNKRVYFKIHTTGTDLYYEQDYNNDIVEIIDSKTWELLKSDIIYLIFSPDMKYYLLPYSLLFTIDGSLVYDINKIPENVNIMSKSEILYACFSPNNKYIILNDMKQKYFIVVDFKSGKILRTINYYYLEDYLDFGVTSDENYLVTASNESSIKIYNLNNSNDAFDKVVLWYCGSRWRLAFAQTSNLILFGGYDGVLRLWKPNFLLTSIEEPIKKIDNESLISPNPASDYLLLPEDLISVDAISVYSVIGMKVLQTIPDGKRIDISAISPGLYFMKVKDKFYKFIKV
jgi:photosystem II stability/assembly factor-like uncharacterized protein